jgi:hypothetical protein
MNGLGNRIHEVKGIVLGTGAEEREESRYQEKRETIYQASNHTGRLVVVR